LFAIQRQMVSGLRHRQSGEIGDVLPERELPVDVQAFYGV
jgi:hypothetical protein